MSKHLLAASCLLALAATTSTAMAADFKSNGAFPTDTLGQWKFGASASYEFKFKELETAIIPDLGTSTVLKEKATYNTLRTGVQAGLGYGVQLGADLGFELAGQNDASLTDGWLFIDTSTGEKKKKVSGIYNPVFSARWDMVKVLSQKESPASLVLEYGYKPAKWGNKRLSSVWIQSNQLLDQPGEYGFDTHTAKAIGSLKIGASRMYLGYEGNFSGKYKGYYDTAYPSGYHVGNIHSFVIGSERAFTPKFSMGADFKYSMIRSRAGYGDGYQTIEGGLNASMKVAKNMWLNPYFKSEVQDERTFQGDGYIARTSSNFGIATGAALKVAF